MSVTVQQAVLTAMMRRSADAIASSKQRLQKTAELLAGSQAVLIAQTLSSGQPAPPRATLSVALGQAAGSLAGKGESPVQARWRKGRAANGRTLGYYD